MNVIFSRGILFRLPFLMKNSSNFISHRKAWGVSVLGLKEKGLISQKQTTAINTVTGFSCALTDTTRLYKDCNK